MSREIKFRAWENDKKVFPVMDITNDFNKRHGSLVYEQFTGLEDSHGMEIHEGDILKFPNLTIGIVVWDDAAFAIKSPGSNAVDYEHSSVLERAVVIGNIHQNPELLNGD